jgi:hypothetical protein
LQLVRDQVVMGLSERPAPTLEHLRNAVKPRPTTVEDVAARSKRILQAKLLPGQWAGAPRFQERRSKTSVFHSMDAAEKIKLALDESRMLVLGAQVLLGFQMRSVFQEEFDALPHYAKAGNGISLLLMVSVLGLLLAPAIQHRVVDNGDATRRLMRVISAAMTAALGLFAFSLAINIFIALERVGGLQWATGGGLTTLALALWFWFGAECLAVLRSGGKDLMMADAPTPLIKKIDQLLTEARVVLPGAQALLGFQLAVILTHAFETLPAQAKTVHALALGLVALCTILLMAPAAYHRIVYAGEAAPQLHQLGSKFLLAATLALALGLSADVYVVIGRIVGQAVGLGTAMLCLGALVGLWHVSPLVLRSQRHAAVETESQPGTVARTPR